MGKSAYFDCFSGISGDMTIAALLDAGLDFNLLKKQLKKINLPGYELKKGYILKNGIKAAVFKVNVRHEQHSHRNLGIISSMIKKSRLDSAIKVKILKIFDVLATAEAKVHGVKKNEIYFHEVGAIDSIIDIAGAVIGLYILGVDRVYSSALPVSSDFINSQHGILPLPAPAAAEMMKGVPLFKTKIKGETVTPTGIAILRGLNAGFEDFPGMVPENIGFGAGSHTFKEIPNVLRIFISGEQKQLQKEIIAMLETNIDNETGEVMGYTMDRLFKAGALDVFFTPIFMKKNRPAYKLSAICDAEDAEKIVKVIFSELKTGGARLALMPRYRRKRGIKSVKTKLGEMDIKIFDENKDFYTLEYEKCAKIARKLNMPLTRIINKADEELAKNAKLL